MTISTDRADFADAGLTLDATTTVSDGSSARAGLDDATLPLLDIFSGIGGGSQVDPGGVFSFSLTIPGDYSTTAGTASRPGQRLDADAAYDGFAVERNYAYDPAANTTTLTLRNASYQPDQFIGLDTSFVGRPLGVAAVPEPAT